MTTAENALFGIHGTALQLRSQRMSLLASNIANAATPGYKARDIDFTKALDSATSGAKGDASEAADAAVEYRVPVEKSLDGNTVELATEQTQFAENAVAYKTTLAFLQGRIDTVMQALKGDRLMSAPMSVFDIAGRAMSAQLVRLNTVASNLANANSVSSTEAGAFHALKPVFTEVSDSPGVATVKVDQVVQSNTQAVKRHDPENPLADKNGDVWDAGVDGAAELVDMLETQRQYQNNVQVMQTAKTLTLDTLKLGELIVTTSTTSSTDSSYLDSLRTSTKNAAAAAATTAGAGSDTIDQAGFLTLLTAQMTNQDPTDPMDTSTMVTQLSQMSTVSGITEMNQTMTTLASSLEGNRIGDAASWIGKNALVSSTTAVPTSDGSYSGYVTLPSDASNMNVSLVDSSGNTVYSENLTNQAAGNVAFSWNGAKSDGTTETGPLSVQVSASGTSGSITPTVSTWSTITGVQSPAGGSSAELSTSLGTVAPTDVLSLS